ncbi:hypothetical protein Tco_1020101 [Tanacetum coccineum]|uniref:Uncharacterized protein n=1 Tax=Tanacetum coccineum TaxID=301880 RepID=A0ABQ5FZB2_9ASTR
MFLRSLPSEWDTHVVKRTAVANNDDKNLAFLTTSSPSSTNTINTVNTGVSTGNTKVNTASTETSTTSFSDATVYAFLSTQPQDILLENAEHQEIKTTEIGIKKAHQRHDMAEDEIQANMALMAFTNSEVSNDKSCLQNYEALKKQYDDLLVKLDDTGFKAATYKRGHKEYLMGLLVKEEKEGFEFKLAKFEKSSKDLDDLLASQVTDKSKKGFGYNAIPSPHPLILNRPTPLDLSYLGLEEFKQPEVNEYGTRDSSLKPTNVCDRESNNSKENTDDSLITNTRLWVEEPKRLERILMLQTYEDWAVHSQLNEKGFVDSGLLKATCLEIPHMSLNLSDFIEFDGGYVYFGGGANGERINRKRGRKNKTLIEAARTMVSRILRVLIPAMASEATFRCHVYNSQYLITNCSVPEVYFGSREVSTAVPEINTATPEGLMGPIPTTEDTQVEDQEIELGNISPSYEVSSTPLQEFQQRSSIRSCDW